MSSKRRADPQRRRVIVGGNVGQRAGDRLRRGLIIIEGDAGARGEHGGFGEGSQQVGAGKTEQGAARQG